MSIESGSPSRWWRLKESLYTLKGSNCPDCGVVHFPERPICPDCGSDANFQNPNSGKVEVVDSQSVPAQSRTNLLK